jgi:rare lipoprotein A
VRYTKRLLTIALLIVASTTGFASSTKSKRHKATTQHKRAVSEITGIASWYGREMRNRHGKYARMANGQVFDPNGLTAASRTLPFGTIIAVTNAVSKMTVEVEITDRGPFSRHRILDLSQAAAEYIGCRNLCRVSYRIVRK